MDGLKHDVLWSVLSTGPNERFSGTNAGVLLGDGIYLGEDAGKADQYATCDVAWDPSGELQELHKRLYGRSYRHQGNVYYMLVCRVSLGYPARTLHGVKVKRDTNGVVIDRISPNDVDTGKPIFPISFRELGPIPDVSPPKVYHSLLAGGAGDGSGQGGRRRDRVQDGCQPH